MAFERPNVLQPIAIGGAQSADLVTQLRFREGGMSTLLFME